MKTRTQTLIISSVLSIVPFCLIVLNLIDIYDVLWSHYDYPFGSEFYSKYSIYRSETIYILYVSIFTIALILNIVFALKMKWKLYILFLLIASAFFIYPLWG